MKRLTVLFTAAALALVGCGDNLQPGVGLGPSTGPGPIDVLPPVADVPDSQPFPNAISFQTPACTNAGGCETVTFCPNGVGNYEPPNGTGGGGDFVYGLDNGEVWGINQNSAFTFEYKPGGLSSPLGNVLIPSFANTGLCENLATIDRDAIQKADDSEFETLGSHGDAARDREVRVDPSTAAIGDAGEAIR